MRSFSVILLSAILLSGCAATGPTFKEHLAASSLAPSTSGRLVFFRTKDTQVYSAVPASVRVDGMPVAACDYAGFNVVDVPAGRHVVSVSSARWNMPGSCDLAVAVTAGDQHFFEIKPRDDHLAASLFGAFLGFGLAQGSGSGPFGLATLGDAARAGLVGAGASALGGAIESAGKQCGGAFSVESIPHANALPRVMDLRRTER
jgi:hypothetical protein